MEPAYRYAIQYLYAKSNKTQFNGQLEKITSFFHMNLHLLNSNYSTT